MGRPDVGLGAVPVQLGPRDRLVAVEHEDQVVRRVESRALEPDHHVVQVGLDDVMVHRLGRGDHVEDRLGVLGRRGTG